MSIPLFPEFTPISLDLKNEMNQELSSTPDGVSEFTFAGLYLFRKRYQYQVSALEDKTLIVSGIQPPHAPEEEAKRFFMTPRAAPGRNVLEELFKTHNYWKNIPESVLLPNKDSLEGWGIKCAEDRDNFDYLYLRTDLAELPGKKYHKKRNLVAQFLKLYAHEEKPLAAELIPDAKNILDCWQACRYGDTDYKACGEALDLFTELDLKGLLLYVDGKPVGWCLGESVAQGKIFSIHFEKALEDYKGIYQFINQVFASTLPESVTHINREQDLGEEGLRQAKMTYRPSGFVRKYTGIIS